MVDIKLIISLLGLGISIGGILSGYFYLKFQTKQNKEDIAAIRLEIKSIKEEVSKEHVANEKRIGDVYELVRTSQAEIVKVLNEIKREFVSSNTCNIRHGG